MIMIMSLVKKIMIEAYSETFDQISQEFVYELIFGIFVMRCSYLEMKAN